MPYVRTSGWMGTTLHAKPNGRCKVSQSLLRQDLDGALNHHFIQPLLREQANADRLKIEMKVRRARRGGFEPPRPCGHRISNPAPYRAGPPPLLATQWHASFKPFCHWKANNEYSDYLAIHSFPWIDIPMIT
jgi:hypothetical protein